MQPLRVVHIISALPVGGVEHNLLAVLPRLDRERFQVSLVCIREPGDLAAPLRAAGVEVDLVPVASRYDPPSLLRLARFLRCRQARIAHCHMRRANTTGRIAAMLARVPVRIATEHDLLLDKRRRHLLVDRVLARYSACVVCVSKAVAAANARAAGIPPAKLRVIYNGLDLQRFKRLPGRGEARARLGLSPARPVVGCVGRLHALKNVEQVLLAMERPELADAVLLVAGDGEERARLQEFAHGHGLCERVRFLGACNDLPALYAAMDAVVIASDSEGFCLVQVEALAAGVPLISTPVGVAAEALVAGKEYVRVATPTGAALARGVAEALEPRRAEALRAAGRRAAARFSLQRQVRLLEELYQQLAERYR